jgi:superfamily I DNA/RNA helicase
VNVVSADSWQPNGIDNLEPAAWDALRDDGCACVTAGPGAGKTEFLAQRASYLLETGLCPAPRRILAISFKRDAAFNLGRRLQQRTPEHASRFASMTFDAFTKHIVDRFKTLLPDYWKMPGEYRIRFVKDREIDNFLNEVALNGPPHMQAAIDAIPRGTFMTSTLGLHALNADPTAPTAAVDYAVQKWWEQSYINKETALVEFVMLNRLAELIVRTSTRLQRALTLTYPFVFVDEFQDTTFAQYAFLHSVFGRRTIVTAVGDRKQRIMGWAGALADAFAEFEADFDARPYELVWNFRSTEALVSLQHRFAQLLDPQSNLAAAQAVSDIDDAAAQIWSFANPQLEAHTVAAFIAADMGTSGRSPASYALVARQKVADFEDTFRTALAVHGVALRNDDALYGEMRLQDLHKDAFGQLLVGLVRLGATSARESGNPQTWINVSATVADLRMGDESGDARAAAIDDELSRHLHVLRAWMRENPCTDDAVSELSPVLIDVIGSVTEGRYRNMFDTADDLAVRVESFEARLRDVSDDAMSWAEAIDAYEAADAVPLLTIHRSKGLEYHTVFFLGLDDDQWWAHNRDIEGSTSTFFVGLSRAAQRVIFTQCDRRGRQQNIADLCEVLDDAGVLIQRFE